MASRTIPHCCPKADGNGATAADNINDIEFLNCTVVGDAQNPVANQYGYQITYGSNIRIIGGTISNAGNGNGSAGVAITPQIGGVGIGPGRITILGADLSAKYPQAMCPTSQEYALLITAVLTDTVTVDNCRMTGYSSSPVSVSGTIGRNMLFITGCEGYNDQNTPLNGGLAPTLLGPKGAAETSTPYFGPSVVAFQNSIPLTVNGRFQLV